MRVKPPAPPRATQVQYVSTTADESGDRATWKWVKAAVGERRGLATNGVSQGDRCRGDRSRRDDNNESPSSGSDDSSRNLAHVNYLSGLTTGATALLHPPISFFFNRRMLGMN